MRKRSSVRAAGVSLRRFAKSIGVRAYRRLTLAALMVAVLVTASLVFAEVKTTDPVTVKVREIGKHLKCQCGCAYTVADCNMLYCHFRDPVNQDIAELVKAGLPDPEILSKIYAKYGEALRTEPVAVGFGAVGWAMPFAALALGLVIAPFVVRRWKANQLQAETGSKSVKVDEDAVRHYEAQIEKDLADDD